MITQEQIKRLIELRGKGLSFAKVAKELGISKQTAIDHAKELELEIANHKALELEEMLEKAKLTKMHRVRYLSTQLERIERTIEARDLNEVPTDKLVLMLERLSKRLGNELMHFGIKAPAYVDIENYKTFINLNE